MVATNYPVVEKENCISTVVLTPKLTLHETDFGRLLVFFLAVFFHHLAESTKSPQHSCFILVDYPLYMAAPLAFKRFAGQVAIVSGGSRGIGIYWLGWDLLGDCGCIHKGIGLGIARRLGREGAKVAIVDLNPSLEAEKTLRDQGIEVSSFKANVTDHKQVKDAVSSIVQVC